MKIPYVLSLTLLLAACTSEETTAPVDDYQAPEVISTIENEDGAHIALDAMVTPEFMQEPEAPDPTDISELYALLEKPAEKFTIPSNRDTVLTCREGTELTIKANSFADARTGEPIDGPVTVAVQEFYSMGDMICSPLHTVGNKGLLETGGMLKIEARAANHRRADLAAGKTMGISMPYEIQKEGMQLFLTKGKGKHMVWVEAEPPAIPPVEFEEEQQTPLEPVLGGVVELMPEFPGGEDALMGYISSNVRYPQLAREAGITGKVYASFVVEKDGSIGEITIRRGIGGGCDQEVIRVIRSLPRWKPAQQQGKPVATMMTIPVTFRLDGMYNWIPPTNDAAAAQAFEDTVTEENFEDVAVNDVKRYVFSTSRLGYINCDRWQRFDGPKVNLMAGLEGQPNIDLKLIFHSQRSIMPARTDDAGQKLIWNNVPVGEAVTLIAFKYENDKVYMATREFTVASSGRVPNFEMKETTLQEVKATAKKLNNISVPI